MKILKKYGVKFSKDIKVVYLKKKNFITFIGPLNKKSLNLKLHILIDKSKNTLYVTKSLKNSSLKLSKTRIAMLQGTLRALLKQCVLEASFLSYKKLKLIGVGFKVFNLKNSILDFKLGFSHSIYFKTNSDVKVLLLKNTILYFFGSSFFSLTQVASYIRSYKIAEPYKGKGILYQNEKIKLKESKKI